MWPIESPVMLIYGPEGHLLLTREDFPQMQCVKNYIFIIEKNNN